MTIPQKVQQAFVSWLKSQHPLADIPQANIYHGIQHEEDDNSDTTIQLPCVICNCDAAEPIAQFSGNRRATAVIEVHSNADDSTQEEHQDRVQAVTEKLLTDTIAANLSTALEQFTVFLVVPSADGWRVDGRSWVSSLQLLIDCAPSDIL